MSDTMLGYLVSLGIIFAGVLWIVAGTIYTASDLCIAIGMVTVAVGWISFMVEFRNRRHWTAPTRQAVFFAVELTGFHEVVSRHDTRPIQTTESRPPRGLA